MMLLLKRLHIIGLLFVCITLALASCADENTLDELLEQSPTATDRMQIDFVANGLSGIGSRSSGTDKSAQEVEIKTLHLFFFDENGEFIRGTEASNFTGYELLGKSSFIMPPNAFDHSLPVMAKIYAVANLETGTITDEEGNLLIKNESDLVNLEYYPKKESSRDITKLPDEGMPMFGACYVSAGSQVVRLVNINTAQSIKVVMKALMARLDITFKLDYSQTANPANPNWPNLRIKEYGINNRALAIGFKEVLEGETSSLLSIKNENPANPEDKYTYLDEFTEPLLSTKTIYDKNSESTTFYVFENMQQPIADFPKTDAEWENKVPGITASEDPLRTRQRYKAKWADEKALSCYLRGVFTTANGGLYHVAYTIHIGKDQIGNYEVKRNNLDEINIQVSELKSIDNLPAEGSVKYDSRITLVDDFNDYFIEIIRERSHDAHYCVTPMDILLFGAANPAINPEMTLEVVSGADWLKLEHIPGECMANGTIPSNFNEHVATGKPYTAGNGIRKYFTKKLFASGTPLVTKCTVTNAGTTKQDKHLDRVYLYLNENLSTHDREGAIRVTFSKNVEDENGVMIRETKTREIKIKQYGLLEVRMKKSSDGKNEAQYFYLEQVEEYADYYDPYDTYNSDMVYQGLPWGLSSVKMGSSGSIVGDNSGTIFNKIYGYGQGLRNTQTILEKAKNKTTDKENINDLTLVMPPRSAAEYCYNKNIRNTDGTLSLSGTSGWFLPDIRQLENMITTYQNRYYYFRNKFYWSSNVSLDSRGSERSKYARATMYDTSSGKYVENGSSQKTNDNPETNHSSGVILHSKPLRIRAAYFHNGGQRLTN